MMQKHSLRSHTLGTFGIYAAATIVFFLRAASALAGDDPRFLSLAVVLDQNITSRDRFKEDAAIYKKLDDQAEKFVRFRLNRMNSKEKLVWIGDCFAAHNEVPDPFCDFTITQKAKVLGIGPEPKSQKEPKPRSAYEVSLALQTKQWGLLGHYSERELINGLKRISGLDKMIPLFDGAMKEKDCMPPRVYSSFALKAEEFFPDPTARAHAISLYDKSINCTRVEDETSYKARYRLALLYIAEDKCSPAAPLLDTVALKVGGEYQSRASYWRYFCAKKLGQEDIAAAHMSRLLKDFQLSYHVLLLQEGSVNELVRQVRNRDPKVRFRSDIRKDLNLVVMAVEVLLARESNVLAQEMLDYLVDRIDQTEPDFRLYVATLQHRLGETLNKFKVLSGVFKDNPELIANTSLQMYYPLKRFDIMTKHKGRLDPYLAASIIRQESAFRENARSQAGAMGLMQLMPGTASRMERVSRRELFDAHTNIRLGVKYFSRVLAKFSNDGELALAAYNAGPDKVDDWKRRYLTTNRMLFVDLIPFKETREYVAAIGRNYFWYLALYDRKAVEESGPNRTLAAQSPLQPPGIMQKVFALSKSPDRPLFSFFLK